MKVLVTGGAGFIGANLVPQLLSRGHEVTVLDDLSTGRLPNLAGCQLRYVEGSILDGPLLARLVPRVDAVVHLAARPSVPRSVEDPWPAHEVNATGTLMVLDAARLAGGVHCIVASSSSVYGADAVLPTTESSAARPASPYAASKAAAEAIALAFQAAYGLPVLVLRLFNVYGPMQIADHAYAAAIPRFVRALLDGGVIQVHGDGTQTRDFTFVGALAAMLVEAVERRSTATTPINAAWGTSHSLLEVIEQLSRIIGTRATLDFSESRPGDVRHSRADGTALTALLPGLSPVSLADGLRATVSWHRREGEQASGALVVDSSGTSQPTSPAVAGGGRDGWGGDAR